MKNYISIIVPLIVLRFPMHLVHFYLSGMNLFKMNQMNLIIKNVNLLLLSSLKITGKKERNCMNTVLITKQSVDMLIISINARNIILTFRKKLNYIKNSKRFVLLRQRIAQIFMTDVRFMIQINFCMSLLVIMK
ncbi:hypothetical protein PVBG_06332 [Plasmodium vivax Brazil I]|uniref:Uncharacterized protein n=1 Tax=Plasmodium vivax (strain Brazil I) TaxID=1033975 RepID=A0A0J9VP06_PLAV1|nr:hypothetical protein PVBG_06332 [Plasmodium vivax Brazil I]